MNVGHLHEEKRLGRRARGLAAAFVVVVSGLSCWAILVHQPSWPAAVAVAAEVAIVAAFCYVVLRRD